MANEMTSKWWMKFVLASLGLPLLLTFALPIAMSAHASVKIEDIKKDDIIVGTLDLGVLQGNNHDNLIIGTQGPDEIFGKGGDDIIYASGSNDKVFAGPGDDQVNAGTEDDYVEGNIGNDVLIGDDGDDIIVGGDGNDQIFGGIGDDTLEGDAGANSFNCGPGVDTITDFNPSQGDVMSPDCEIFNQQPLPSAGIAQ